MNYSQYLHSSADHISTILISEQQSGLEIKEHLLCLQFKALHTQVSIARLAELSSSTKTEIKWQLVRLAQPASIFNGCESILGVVVSHKPIVVPVTENQNHHQLMFSLQGQERIINPLIQF